MRYPQRSMLQMEQRSKAVENVLNQKPSNLIAIDLEAHVFVLGRASGRWLQCLQRSAVG